MNKLRHNVGTHTGGVSERERKREWETKNKHTMAIASSHFTCMHFDMQKEKK